MNIKTTDIKEALSVENYITLLEDLDANISTNDDRCLIMNTICHGGTSQKLYFYKDTKIFTCYSECGNLDIFTILENVYGYSIYESILHIIKICKLDGFDFRRQSHHQEGVFGKDPEDNLIDDWNFINRFKRFRDNKNRTLENEHTFKILDDVVFNVFEKNVFYQSWIDEHISIDSLIKYNIMYYVLNHQIAIPHYDEFNNLIGIRCRNLDEDNILNLGKYNPVRVGNYIYSHSLGKNLFGLNQNKEVIINKRKVMLVESEKSVMQCDSYFGKDNFTLALCNYNMSKYQIQMILSLKVKEVFIALDRQFEDYDSQEHQDYINHIRKNFIIPLSPYVNVFILYDSNGLLGYKQSPTDCGKDVLLEMMRNKMLAN